ncbi:hypothetical protein Z946_3189 [Sulfitobacter noctilucicola]|uniref:Putative membrane protein YagU involved in acid resistance n=1 Tax=Sulfitobacter noctilucicola TaxID=1342301 RepID=A0A7W6Q678_9RHOB|nr:hypothetical protein [Sulfitobacter noctilucicola]KIN64298.1 hypothetical protein Z946_3189 [Sulfitobacter noctilucicola]MBB4174535.1 putative membrane protein YagU involved in acid resistance [Sulfitobacter noctilucicola]
MNDTLSTKRPAFPIIPLLIAGVIGEVAFELYAWLLSPALFGPSLEPANLVIALTRLTTGMELSYGVAFPVHFVIGAVGFSFFLWIVYRLTGLGLILSGALAGVILWFVAQGILAPIVGRDFMMGFGPYTQSSFVGHVGMCILMALVLRVTLARPTTATV